MRKLLRSIAHARMEKEGIQKPNKKRSKDMKSYFANHWREYAGMNTRKSTAL